MDGGQIDFKTEYFAIIAMNGLPLKTPSVWHLHNPIGKAKMGEKQKKKKSALHNNIENKGRAIDKKCFENCAMTDMCHK